jgi:hypothetical protein
MDRQSTNPQIPPQTNCLEGVNRIGEQIRRDELGIVSNISIGWPKNSEGQDDPVWNKKRRTMIIDCACDSASMWSHFCRSSVLSFLFSCVATSHWPQPSQRLLHSHCWLSIKYQHLHFSGQTSGFPPCMLISFRTHYWHLIKVLVITK